MAMNNSAIRLEVTDNIGFITIQRPAAKNALDVSAMHDFLEVLNQVHANQQMKAVFLLGQPGIFCAGGDVVYFQYLCGLAQAERLSLLDSYIRVAQDVIRSLAAIDCPVVVGIDGVAAGYGLSLACLADQVIATDRSRLLPAYTAIGASPDGGLTYFLPEIIGKRRALNWTLHNKPMPLQEALSLGLVSELCAVDEFDEKINALAGLLAESPRDSFRVTKRLFREQSLQPLSDQLDKELSGFLENAASADFCEGVTAFFDKRPAAYAK